MYIWFLQSLPSLPLTSETKWVYLGFRVWLTALMGIYNGKHGRLPECYKKEKKSVSTVSGITPAYYFFLYPMKKKIKKHHNIQLSHWNYKFQPTWPLRTSLRLWKLHSKGLDLIRCVAALHCWISCKSHPYITASY